MTTKSFLLAMPVMIGLSIPALDAATAQGMRPGMMERGGMGQGMTCPMTAGMMQGGMGQGMMGQAARAQG